MNKWLCLLIAITLLLSTLLTGCGGPSEPEAVDATADSAGLATTTWPGLPEALQDQSVITNLAVRQYIFARLLMDELLVTDLASLSASERQALIDDSTAAWERAVVYAESADLVADQTILTLSAGQSDWIRLNSGAEQTASEWAKSITGQFDQLKGANRFKQLAQQLGTDAKSAYQQLTMAQNIIQGEAALEAGDAEQWEIWLKNVKLICKTGLFVTGAAVTAGATAAPLGFVTLGEATGLVVGGADVILDVQSEVSNIYLGADHQVTLGMNALKDKLAPLSFVVGLATLDGAQVGERIAFVGENLTSWFFEGKIGGIQVSATGDPASPVRIGTKLIDTRGKSDKQVQKELEDAGFVVDTTAQKPVRALRDDYVIDDQTAQAILDAVLSDLSAQSDGAEPGDTTEESAAAANFAWVQIEQENYDSQAEVDHSNAGGVYEISASSAPGSYSCSSTYIGESDDYYDPDLISGENLTVQADWSTPPVTIQGGEKVALSVSIGASANTQSYYAWSASTGAYFDAADMAPGFSSGACVDFVNANGNDSFEVSKGNDYATVSDTVTAAAPTGSEVGERMAIVVGFYMGTRQGTRYLYEWQAVG